MLQILTTQTNKETCCKYSQHKQIKKRAANTHNTTKYRNEQVAQTTTGDPNNAQITPNKMKMNTFWYKYHG